MGEISVRSLYRELVKSGHDSNEFVRELLWRDFASYLAYHFPHSLKKDSLGFSWTHEELKLKAWKEGKTGYPVVDAAMRELHQTGWMHNRSRMIVGSFLTKHLLHSWKEGYRWFWDELFDSDYGNNTLGWQWISGCGLDSSPFFRIMNPLLQAKRFDPEGDYVRTFLPEIAKLPNKWIHSPWEAPQALLEECGIQIGRTYPPPIVSLIEGRERALHVYSSRHPQSRFFPLARNDEMP